MARARFAGAFEGEGFVARGATAFAAAGFMAAGARRPATLPDAAAATGPSPDGWAVTDDADDSGVVAGATLAAVTVVTGAGTTGAFDFGAAFLFDEEADAPGSAGAALPSVNEGIWTDFGAGRFFCDIYLRREK